MARDTPPEIDDDPAQRVLLAHWRRASADLAAERARGPMLNNLVMAIAGHKAEWLRQIIRDVRAAQAAKPVTSGDSGDA